MFNKAILLAFGLAILAAPVSADAAYAGKGHRFDKQCDEGQGMEPGYGSPRCRMEASCPAEMKTVIILGMRFLSGPAPGTCEAKPGKNHRN